MLKTRRFEKEEGEAMGSQQSSASLAAWALDYLLPLRRHWWELRDFVCLRQGFSIPSNLDQWGKSKWNGG